MGSCLPCGSRAPVSSAFGVGRGEKTQACSGRQVHVAIRCHKANRAELLVWCQMCGRGIKRQGLTGPQMGLHRRKRQGRQSDSSGPRLPERGARGQAQHRGLSAPSERLPTAPGRCGDRSFCLASLLSLRPETTQETTPHSLKPCGLYTARPCCISLARSLTSSSQKPQLSHLEKG